MSPEKPAAPAASPGFRDVTRSVSDLPSASSSYGATFADYNADGWPDLLVGRHQGHARFLVSESGVFSERKERALLAPAPGRVIYDRHACAWGEANGDGRPDLLCTSGADDGAGRGPNKLLLQERDGGLTDAAMRLGVDDPLGRGRSVNWFDFDGDGDLDLFIGNEIRRRFPSRLFENTGEEFRSVDDPVARDLPVRSSSWGDWEGDGDPDLLVLGHGFVATRAFVGTGSGFEEIDVPGITGVEWLSAAFEDLDSDGWIDAVLVSERRAEIFMNRSGLLRSERAFTFREGRAALPFDADNDADLDLFIVRGARGDPPRPGAPNLPDVLLLREGDHYRRAPATYGVAGPSTGNGENVVAADYDRDGGVDLFIGNGYLNVEGPFELLRNEAAADNWVTVVLRGTKENPFAIGARVIARAGPLEQHRFVTDEVVFRGQSSPGTIHFGLGDETRVSIEVGWPDGTTTCARGDAGAHIELDIGSSESC